MPFEKILPWTLKYEGGKVDDPDDAGGRTAYGVTQRTFTKWLKSHAQPSRDVWTITPTERSAVYRELFWNPVDHLDLPDDLTMAAFDFAVHSGYGRATKYLPNTLAGYLTARRGWFESIIARKPSQAKYRKGWMRRVNDLEVFLGKREG